MRTTPNTPTLPGSADILLQPGDSALFLNSLAKSLQIRRHLQLFNWLQGEIQALIPHDALIAAWGDFALGLIQFDVVSGIPGVRTQHLPDDQAFPFMLSIFNWWVDSDRAPLMYSPHDSLDVSLRLSDELTIAGIAGMQSVIVHGIKDARGRHDCLYVALGKKPIGDQPANRWFEVLLPYIDTALRQVPLMPSTKPQQQFATPPPIDYGISHREEEIMHWVRMGKTNQEIGQILNISAFTVKNHLQRIFRKLNVLNRAQAVAKHEYVAKPDRS